MRAAVATRASSITSRVEHADTGGGGGGQDRVDTLHIRECRLTLAVVETITDDCCAIINHGVERRLEARTHTCKRRVVHYDLRSRCKSKHHINTEEDVALICA